MQINTVKEQDAYDAGWADGKDYWMPLEQDRLFQVVQPWFTEQLKNDRLSPDEVVNFVKLFRGTE
jgi:hypothetical protein